MKKLSIPLAVAAVVLLACSTADAGWTYIGGVRVYTPAPVVYRYPAYTVPAYTYTYPTYAYPTYTYPRYAYPVYSPSVVVGTKVYVPRRPPRRTVWTVW